MSKLSRDNINFIDLIIYDHFVYPYTSVFYNYGFTPNTITFLSFITSVFAIFFLKNNYYILFAILFFIGYIFDCMDGYMARKFNMSSNIGDLLDHGSDLLEFIFLLYVIYPYVINHYYRYPIVCISIILLIIHQINVGCSELNSSVNTGYTLKLYELLCPNKEIIKYTKYFGGGFFICYLILLSIFIISYK